MILVVLCVLYDGCCIVYAVYGMLVAVICRWDVAWCMSYVM